jgi:NAD(P)-dependent dehydrogenase (short-subunit alcohol dehydrogenase family)
MKMDLSGKTCLVTGASSGLGLAAAKKFAAAGANVVMLCRDVQKGETAREEIRIQTPCALTELAICDLASIASVQNFCRQFKENHASLDILFNNAAVVKTRRTVSADSLELMFQTNYLAPFMLTNALLDLLRNSAPARIINIAVPPDKLTLDLDDLQAVNSYKAMNAFMRTKLCLLLYSLELSRRLEGSGVTLNILDPGPFKSDLARDMPRLVTGLIGLFEKSADAAAEHVLRLAAADDLQGKSGLIYVEQKLKTPVPYWQDQALRERLWNDTQAIIDAKTQTSNGG